ncbi:MAG: hypothetical protein OEW32_04765 [Nitrospira sp.]|nr:hypothetical protein [Nitrospira sp.]
MAHELHVIMALLGQIDILVKQSYRDRARHIITASCVGLEIVDHSAVSQGTTARWDAGTQWKQGLVM